MAAGSLISESRALREESRLLRSEVRKRLREFQEKREKLHEALGGGALSGPRKQKERIEANTRGWFCAI
jgi:hypothetical protein